MEKFVAFDVETPNFKNNRISAIGISVIENNEIVEEFFSYVNPETHFDYFNVRLTGINEQTVKNAPTFPQAWQKIKPFMEMGTIVAHNAVFDLSVLKSCLTDYNISWREKTDYLCTVQMGRRLLPGISHRLNVLSDYYKIELDHHKADSDSHACAQILLNYLKTDPNISKYKKVYFLTPPKT